jgi:phage shock protein PspC (stress-responsive transcriptional regulator)
MTENPEHDRTEETAQMDDAAQAPPPPPPDPPVKRLTRSKDDRMIAGVAGGVSKYFGVDPVIVRIAAVVLVFFGGAGALLYLAGVLLMPNEGEEPKAGEAQQRNRALVILGVVALILLAGPFLFAPAFIAGGLLFPLAFLVIAGLVMAWLVTGRWPERQAGPIVLSTLLGLGVLIVLFFVALGAAWGSAAGGDGVVAGLVIAAGVALLVGAFVKPVRWLIPLGLALALPAGFVQAADIDLDGGYGEKTYRPGTVANIRDKYEIGVGELTVDLRPIDFPVGDHTVNLEGGIGHLIVLVPDDVCVVTRAEVGMGAVELFDHETGGIDVDHDDERTARPGKARVIVDADLGIGAVEVDHELDRDDFEFGPGRRFRDRDSLDDASNPACVGG